MFMVGAIDTDRIGASQKTGVPLPSLHSSLFCASRAQRIRTGLKAMTVACWN